jgi:hypothetical protein
MLTVYPQAREFEPERYVEVPVSPHAQDMTAEQKLSLAELIPAGGKILKFHKSLCPGCVEAKEWERMLIPSAVYVKGGKVWMVKTCPRHGPTKSLYWSDFEMYRKAEEFQDPGLELETTQVGKKASEVACPLDCGLCSEHETHTNLANIVLTNRCDLSCWYCFFYAKKGQPVYEPSLGQIRQMLHTLRAQKPIPCNAVQLTGGEPLMRDDIVEIIEIAKEEGFDHIQLNTNGIRLAQEPELATKIAELGSHVLYLSFDGATPQTNPKNYWEAPRALENCYNAGIGVVLVPTVINTVNDHEIGDIIRFGVDNIHIIRGVNYQPVSFVGQMPDRLRRKQRITIPGVIGRIEEQTDGAVRRDDFYPVPVAKQVTDFIEIMRGRRTYRLSEHFACGMATYVFRDGKRMVPLPRFFDVEGFFEFLEETGQTLKGKSLLALRKPLVYSKLLFAMKKYLDERKKPKDLKFVRSLSAAFSGGNYRGLGVMHHDALFVGMMHFQDPYNWDIDRIHKCGIHYAVPDGRLIPFCTFNVIPALYRDKIQEKFSEPSEKWEARTGKTLTEDKYRRKVSEEEKEKADEFYARPRGKPRKRKDDEWGDEPAKPTRRKIKSPKPAETRKKPITRGMPIMELVSLYPETVPMLVGEGIHCVGCSMAGMETLEQGLKGHGKTDEEINDIINRMRHATGQ